MHEIDTQALSDELFLLLSYMLSSAQGLVGEPADYGVFRMLDASGRLLEIMENYGLSDEFTSQLKQSIDQEREGSMDNDRQNRNVNAWVLQIADYLNKKYAS
jgi:hypothetical protein